MSEPTYSSGNEILGAIADAIAGAEGSAVQQSGPKVRKPAGPVIAFDLQEPAHVATWSDPGYLRGQYRYHCDNDWYR